MIMLETPVVLFVFNRPELTARSFECIRSVQPLELFIIADGPRVGNNLDIELCSVVRKIVQNIDWKCKKHFVYAESNLGLKKRVSSGLNYVFEKVDKAIILEDDCIPHEDFFNFCDELLGKYENDDRISVITGNNFQRGNWRGEGSYYFSKYNHCWGWATWKRAWDFYDGELSFWPTWKLSGDWKKLFLNNSEMKYWEAIFDDVYRGGRNSWAYPWTASVWKRNGLTATPNINLVTNIGFDERSTHTTSKNVWYAHLPSRSIGSLVHPKSVEVCIDADRFTFTSVFRISFFKRIRSKFFKYKRWLQLDYNW